MTIDDRKHEGLLKIGEVFVDNDIADSSTVQQLSNSVRQELDKRSYMNGVKYNIVYVECTTYEQSTKCYKADDVYRTLKEMGVASTTLNTIAGEPADVWFAAEPFDPCKKQVFDQQFSEKLISADFGKLVLHVVIDKAVMRQRAAASLLGA